MKYTFDGVELGLVSGTTEICDSVPLGTYTFEYSKITGLHVVRTSDIPEVDFMVFGKINYRVEKTFSAYKRRNPKNTGVLLSGEPGMGKSLFVRIMSGKALSNGIPVFVVKENLPGVVDFISELKCPALIVLDEFEKTFSQSEHESDNDDGSNSSQDKFLSVMDGVGGVSSKLFVAAVNEVDKVSRFMLNRPGRFLYHFEFNSLGNDEICEVCDSKLVKIGLKNELLMRLVGHSINYDSLFAIIDELNSGADIDKSRRSEIR